MFNPDHLDDSFFNSVVMVISKAAPDIKHDVMLKRIDKLRDSIDKDDATTRRLLERIMENEALLIFHKVTNDKAEAEEVCGNWKKLSGMAGFDMKKEHLKDMGWSNEESANLKKDVWDKFQGIVGPLMIQFEEALNSKESGPCKLDI